MVTKWESVPVSYTHLDVYKRQCGYMTDKIETTPADVGDSLSIANAGTVGFDIRNTIVQTDRQPDTKGGERNHTDRRICISGNFD